VNVDSGDEGALDIVARPDGRDAGLPLLQEKRRACFALGLPTARIAGCLMLGLWVRIVQLS
jgi:hypothetical protein